MSDENPYVVLGIAPTLDFGQIKRAYFQLLPRFAPHSDPLGFRRLRAAYDQLSGDGLLAAYVTAPIDIEAELANLAAAHDTHEDAPLDASEQLAAFEALLHLDLAAARARARQP
jgi:hypothetical protein